MAAVVLSDLPRLVEALRLGGTGRGRRVRERSGLSLRQLAVALGVNAGDLSRWERDLARPRPASALRWLDAVETLDAATPPTAIGGATSTVTSHLQVTRTLPPGDSSIGAPGSGDG
ncbi:MAG: helix-turn-helix domain-containing protein [Acidimicrobiales bacterium]